MSNSTSDFDLLFGDDCYTKETGAGNDLAFLTQNWQSAAASGIAVSTVGLGAILTATAFPALFAGAVASSGALAYTGNRVSQGKPAFPWEDEKKDSSDKSDK